MLVVTIATLLLDDAALVGTTLVVVALVYLATTKAPTETTVEGLSLVVGLSTTACIDSEVVFLVFFASGA